MRTQPCKTKNLCFLLNSLSRAKKKRRRRNRTFYCLFPQLIYLDCYSLCIIDIVDVISLSQMIRLSICLIHILMTCPISKLCLQHIPINWRSRRRTFKREEKGFIFYWGLISLTTLCNRRINIINER